MKMLYEPVAEFVARYVGPKFEFGVIIFILEVL